MDRNSITQHSDKAVCTRTNRKNQHWFYSHFMTALFVGVFSCLAGSFISSSPASAETNSIPDNAHPNKYGDGWECDLSYRLEGEECVAIVVPGNAYPTNRTYGSGWACMHGFVEVGGTSCTEVIVPEGGYLDPSGERWRCLRGYTRVDDSCQKIVVPDNAYLTNSTYGSAWHCNRGYEKDGEACVAVAVPENAFLNASTSGRPWTCERGFFERDGRCDAVFVPENAFYDDAIHGVGWKCERGYEASGDRCNAIELPANAHIDRSGNGWQCHKNYHRSEGLCVLNQ
ncbi:hypothetical protein [Ruegeria lacuscaerulensis]|uniref:hypothetical protein n=1 Tax=Ruegeria lacuscaerulensis TaxID=55218 RepID=UPI00147A2A18|nr:hypothetical protein [Ruegeria lacuscaerulensis]